MPIANDIDKNNEWLCCTRLNSCSVTTMQLKGGQIWGDSRGLEDLSIV